MKGKKAAPLKPVGELNLMEAQYELAQLAKEIAHHRKRYYQKDAPEISDAAFDALMQRGADEKLACVAQQMVAIRRMTLGGATRCPPKITVS